MSRSITAQILDFRVPLPAPEACSGVFATPQRKHLCPCARTGGPQKNGRAKRPFVFLQIELCIDARKVEELQLPVLRPLDFHALTTS